MILNIFIDLFEQVIHVKTFPLDDAKKFFQVPCFIIGIGLISFKWIVITETVDQFHEAFCLLKFIQRLQFFFMKEVHVLLDHHVAEGVEGMNMNTVSIRANHINQPLAHGQHTGVGIGKTKNVGREGICFQ